MGMVMYLRQASPSDIARVGDDPEAAVDFVFAEEGGAELVDFDKGWQALHYLLTGDPYSSDSPLDIIAGDAPQIGDDSIERSPAWLITPDRMVAFATALAGTTDEEFASRYDLDDMVAKDIYIADAFDGLDRVEALQYILQGMPALRALAGSCAANGDGALRLLA